MRKFAFLLLGLFLLNQLSAQENAIKISSPTSEKVVVIKENKRIKIKMVDGQKLSGRFKIADSHSVFLENQQIPFTDIIEIKRNPLLLSIFSSSFLIYAGAITAGMGAIIGLFAEASGFLLIIPGAALLFAGIKSPNVLKNYKAERDWNFELITTSK
jgi:hypothetical protein